MEKTFVQQLLNAIKQFFFSLFYLLFIIPFGCWKKAMIRLNENSENSSLSIDKIQTRWPFLTWLKRIFFAFFIDGVTFISYFIGVLIALYGLFTQGFGSFIFIPIGTYYFPPMLAVFRDFVVIMLLPFQKFLSWSAKPAQQLDLDVHNHTPEK